MERGGKDRDREGEIFNKISKETKYVKKIQICTKKKRSKQFERVSFYTFRILSPTKTFSSMCESFSQDSEFPRVMPGMFPYALYYTKSPALNLGCICS